MLEKLIRRWREAALFRASPVGSYLDDYTDQLEEDGYCKRVATSCGRLHDAVHGNHGADDYLPHGSLALFEPRRG